MMPLRNTTAPTPTPATNGVPTATVYYGSHRERDDDYFGVMFQFSSKHRVIVDADCLQFIMQKRHSEGAHGGVWRAMGYATSKDGLIALCARSLPSCGPSFGRARERLPARPRDCSLQNWQPLKTNNAPEGPQAHQGKGDGHGS